MDYVEIKVVDQENKLVRVNESGELLVRGYNTMLGYWDDKKKTEEAFTQDRFYRTGYKIYKYIKNRFLFFTSFMYI